MASNPDHKCTPISLRKRTIQDRGVFSSIISKFTESEFNVF